MFGRFLGEFRNFGSIFLANVDSLDILKCKGAPPPPPPSPGRNHESNRNGDANSNTDMSTSTSTSSSGGEVAAATSICPDLFETAYVTSKLRRLRLASGGCHFTAAQARRVMESWSSDPIMALKRFGSGITGRLLAAGAAGAGAATLAMAATAAATQVAVAAAEAAVRFFLHASVAAAIGGGGNGNDSGGKASGSGSGSACTAEGHGKVVGRETERAVEDAADGGDGYDDETEAEAEEEAEEEEEEEEETASAKVAHAMHMWKAMHRSINRLDTSHCFDTWDVTSPSLVRAATLVVLFARIVDKENAACFAGCVESEHERRHIQNILGLRLPGTCQ
jgi:hypothetical protein